MPSQNRLIFDLDNLQSTAKKFLKLTRGIKKFAFYGQMGAGKTTFITALFKEIGTVDLVSSPTFSIINEYEILNNKKAYHIDCYRIKDTTELLDIGFDDYLEEDTWIFIEWPEKAENLLTDDFRNVTIEIVENTIRQINF